jgi:hypothetical protein
LLEVFDETFVARFGEIMIGPVCIDLQKSTQTTSGIQSKPISGSEAAISPVLGCSSHRPTGKLSRASQHIKIQCIVQTQHSAHHSRLSPIERSAIKAQGKAKERKKASKHAEA